MQQQNKLKDDPQSIHVLPHSQYLRKVEFDNLCKYSNFRPQDDVKSEVNLNINVEEIETATPAVVIKLTLNSINKESVFNLQLEYVGKFKINVEDPEVREQVLRVYCAQMIYPYVSQIVSNITGEGDLIKIRLAPVDFQEMYKAFKAEKKRDAKILMAI